MFGLVGRQRFEASAKGSPVHECVALEIGRYLPSQVSTG
jgi:hypothetical protein